MKTILLATVIVSGWVAMGLDFMHRNDEHMFRVMGCMKRVSYERHVSSQEAFIVCEREAK